MSLHRSLLAFMLSLSSVVVFAPSFPLPQAIAQNTEQRPSDRGKARLMQDLNLTPEQIKQMQAIQSQYRDQISQRRQAAKQAQQELLDLMAGTASETQVREKYRQVETLKQQASQLRFDSMLAMREVLTPEQRRQFGERVQNRRDYKNRDRGEDQG